MSSEHQQGDTDKKKILGFASAQLKLAKLISKTCMYVRVSFYF